MKFITAFMFGVGSGVLLFIFSDNEAKEKDRHLIIPLIVGVSLLFAVLLNLK